MSAKPEALFRKFFQSDQITRRNQLAIGIQGVSIFIKSNPEGHAKNDEGKSNPLYIYNARKWYYSTNTVIYSTESYRMIVWLGNAA